MWVSSSSFRQRLNLCETRYPVVITHGALKKTAWWFGTFFFSIYWESSSRLTFIFFQRGRYTTNQKNIDDFPRCNVSDVGIFGRAIFDDTRPLVICYIANWKITMLWENPLFLWPFSIAFCMFTRG